MSRKRSTERGQKPTFSLAKSWRVATPEEEVWAIEQLLDMAKSLLKVAALELAVGSERQRKQAMRIADALETYLS